MTEKNVLKYPLSLQACHTRIEDLETERDTLKHQVEALTKNDEYIQKLLDSRLDWIEDLQDHLAKTKELLRSICKDCGTEGCDETCEADGYDYEGCYTQQIWTALGLRAKQ